MAPSARSDCGPVTNTGAWDLADDNVRGVEVRRRRVAGTQRWGCADVAEEEVLRGLFSLGRGEFSTLLGRDAQATILSGETPKPLLPQRDASATRCWGGTPQPRDAPATFSSRGR